MRKTHSLVNNSKSHQCGRPHHACACVRRRKQAARRAACFLALPWCRVSNEIQSRPDSVPIRAKKKRRVWKCCCRTSSRVPAHPRKPSRAPQSPTNRSSSGGGGGSQASGSGSEQAWRLGNWKRRKSGDGRAQMGLRQALALCRIGLKVHHDGCLR